MYFKRIKQNVHIFKGILVFNESATQYDLCLLYSFPLEKCQNGVCLCILASIRHTHLLKCCL